MIDEQGNHIGGHQQNEVDDGCDKCHKSEESDSDFDDDDDAIMRQLRDKRIKEMKQETKQKLEDQAKGHGKYQEIAEDEFLPTVTKSMYTVVHCFHKDFERCKIVDMHLSLIVREH